MKYAIYLILLIVYAKSAFACTCYPASTESCIKKVDGYDFIGVIKTPDKDKYETGKLEVEVIEVFKGDTHERFIIIEP